jgi:hypothetical protein
MTMAAEIKTQIVGQKSKSSQIASFLERKVGIGRHYSRLAGARDTSRTCALKPGGLQGAYRRTRGGSQLASVKG